MSRQSMYKYVSLTSYSYCDIESEAYVASSTYIVHNRLIHVPDAYQMDLPSPLSGRQCSDPALWLHPIHTLKLPDQLHVFLLSCLSSHALISHLLPGVVFGFALVKRSAISVLLLIDIPTARSSLNSVQHTGKGVDCVPSDRTSPASRLSRRCLAACLV